MFLTIIARIYLFFVLSSFILTSFTADAIPLLESLAKVLPVARNSIVALVILPAITLLTLFEAGSAKNFHSCLFIPGFVSSSVCIDYLMVHTLPDFFPGHSHFFEQVPSPTIRLRKKDPLHDRSQAQGAYSQESLFED